MEGERTKDSEHDEERGSPALREVCEPEWLDWYRLTPQERWRESMKLWETFRLLGGSLDPEPDYQSPFYFPEDRRSTPAQERSSVRLVRRSGV
jgi:hypothetical protein